MRLSLIIRTCNLTESLDQSLDALAAAQIVANFEPLIVDNG